MSTVSATSTLRQQVIVAEPIDLDELEYPLRAASAAGFGSVTINTEHAASLITELRQSRARVAESAEARVKELEGRRFPIMGGPSLPWAMIEPHRIQALSNHSQTLEQLAERSGLDPSEALAVLESRRWHIMDPTFALASLTEALRRWEDRPLLARVRKLEAAIETISSGIGYKPLGRALDTVERLAQQVDSLNRNLNGEIAEHERHHVVEAELQARVKELEAENARLKEQPENTNAAKP